MADQINYLLFNNPLAQKVISTTKNVFCKNGSAGVSTVAKAAEKIAPPVILSLYQQGGKSSSVFIRIAGISGAAAVALGSYGAHKKEWPIIENDTKRVAKEVFEVANKYHYYNTLALLAVPLVKRPWLTGSLMTTGIILFSGTCYYAALTGDQRFNRLAPVGGTTLILAWISMAFF